MRHNSQAENITFIGIGLAGLGKIEDFRCHVCTGSTSDHRRKLFGIERKPEIDDSGLHSVQINDNVLGLDVSMNDILFMALVQTRAYSRNDGPYIILLKPITVVNDCL